MTSGRRLGTGIAAAALVVIAGTAAAFLAGSRRDVTTSSSEAYEAYRRGRENELKLYHRDAAAAYADALSHDSGFLMATVRLAVLTLERDPAQARSLFRAAARSRDGATDREKRLYDIYEKQIVEKDRAAAEKLTEDYLRTYPKDPEGYHLRASQLMRRGESKEALALFTRLIAVNPNYAIAYNTLGYHWMERRDFARAEDSLKRYRFLAPDQANPYDSLGELYANIGRYEEAEENLNRALELKADFIPAIGHLGTVAVGKGDFASAAAHYRRAAELSDEIELKTQFSVSEALCQLEMGDQAGAVARLDALPAPPSEPKEKAEHVRFLVSLVRAVVVGTAPPELPPRDPSSKADGKDAALAVGLAGSIDEARRGDIGAARAFAAAELPGYAQRQSPFGYYPYFSMLWIHLADRLGTGGEAGEAGEILKVHLERNPRFQPALDAQARLRGETVARALQAPHRSP